MHKICLFTTILFLAISSVKSQEILSTRSDISYEISADSLFLNNTPQDVSITVTCESIEEIEYYVLIADNIELLWTIVSAELNNQPLWLIMDEEKPNREDILAWYSKQSSKELRIYPPAMPTNYKLEMVLRVSLLRSGGIENKSNRELILAAQSNTGLSRCMIAGNRNKIVFK